MTTECKLSSFHPISLSFNTSITNSFIYNNINRSVQTLVDATNCNGGRTRSRVTHLHIHDSVQRQQKHERSLAIRHRRRPLMSYDELNRLIVRSTAAAITAAADASICAAVAIRHVASANKAVSAATDASAVFPQRFGGDDDSPNTQEKMDESDAKNDGIHGDERREKLILVLRPNPLAILAAPRIRFTLFDFCDPHSRDAISQRDGRATSLQKRNEAAKDGEAEEGDEALVASGSAGRESKVSKDEEERRRHDGRSDRLIHFLMARLETPDDDEDDGDVGGAGYEGEKRLQNGVRFDGGGGQGVIDGGRQKLFFGLLFVDRKVFLDSFRRCQ